MTTMDEKIARAAQAIVPDLALAEAGSTLAQAVSTAHADADRRGIKIRTHARAWLDDGSAGWAVALADMLVQTPSKATLRNAALAALITQRLGMTKDFDPKRFSKPLSATAPGGGNRSAESGWLHTCYSHWLGHCPRCEGW